MREYRGYFVPVCFLFGIILRYIAMTMQHEIDQRQEFYFGSVMVCILIVLIGLPFGRVLFSFASVALDSYTARWLLRLMSEVCAPAAFGISICEVLLLVFTETHGNLNNLSYEVATGAVWGYWSRFESLIVMSDENQSDENCD